MSHPILVIVGGINGAGKTTTVQKFAAMPALATATFLNPDAVVADILKSEPGLPQQTADYRGMRMVAGLIEDLLSRSDSFVAETVLANNAYRRICLRALDLGFEVHVHWVGLPAVEMAIRRVALRVSKGGHNVPEADIRRRWPLTHENLAWFVRHAHEVQAFDNSDTNPEPALVATARNGRLLWLDQTGLPDVTAVLAPLLDP